MSSSDSPQIVRCGLTLEDELTLTRIRNKAKSLSKKEERDQYFWATVYKLVCISRAYKSVLHRMDVHVEPQVMLFDEDGDSVEV